MKRLLSLGLDMACVIACVNGPWKGDPLHEERYDGMVSRPNLDDWASDRVRLGIALSEAIRREVFRSA